MHISESGENVIKEVIKRLKVEKPPGTDSQSTETLKAITFFIRQPLIYFINKAISSGVVLSDFKDMITTEFY